MTTLTQLEQELQEFEAWQVLKLVLEDNSIQLRQVGQWQIVHWDSDYDLLDMVVDCKADTIVELAKQAKEKYFPKC